MPFRFHRFAVICLALICCLCMPAASLAAGENGSVTEVEAQRIVMQPNTYYKLNDNRRATNMIINAAGDYYLMGSSQNTLLTISAPENAEVTLHLDNVKMAPNESAPGFLTDRSPLTIADTGAIVHLKSTANSTNEFYSYNAAHGYAAFNYTSYPAIRKDGLKTKLIFESEGDSEERGWGKIIAKADDEDLFTPGIGCYDRYMGTEKYSFGNVWFESGIIEATGANGTAISFEDSHVSGPGIGGGWGTTVDGLHFTGASVYAYSLSPSSAAIGTSLWGQNIVLGCFPVGITVHNIDITGGKVHAEIKGSEHGNFYYGSAAIGGGTFCGAEGITISGGTVEALARGSMGGAGIGGGYVGDGGTPAHPIEITGGTVTAIGGAAGIGAGQFGDREYGDAVIHISGGTVNASSTNGGPGIGGNRTPEGRLWATAVDGDLGAKSSKTEITISGGTVTAKGSHGGSGIGTFNDGSVNSITISGGKVLATGGSKGVGIGTNCHYDSTTIRNNNLGSVTITGGRVKATGSPAGIGGMAVNKSGNHQPCESIYISGGNVAADVYSVTPKDRPDGSPVAMHSYILLNGGNAFDFDNQRVTELVSLPESSLVSSYGTNDMYLFSAGSSDNAGVYVWLDKTYLATALTVDRNTRYTGFDTLKPKHMDPHYPAIRATLKANTASLPEGVTAEDGSALLYHAWTGAENLVAASSPGLRPRCYLSENSTSETLKVMESNGALNPNAGNLTDENCRFLATEDMLTGGVTLYALWDEVIYDILFDAGKPERASTVPSGSVSPITGIHGSQSVTLPQNGFTLPGYTFTGWGFDPESGATYQPGDSVHDLTLYDSITLYAQWEPLTYSNIYNDTQGHTYNEQGDSITHAFDEIYPLTLFSYLESTENFVLPDGKAFVGWKQSGIVPGTLYGDGAEVCNLCTIREDGTLEGWTLEAVLADKGLLAVSVSVDMVPQKQVNAKITVSDGTAVYQLTPDPDREGLYTISATVAGGMKLYFDGQDTGINCTGQDQLVTLPFYTCSASAGEHIAFASVSVSEGPPAAGGGVLYGNYIMKGSQVYFTARPEPCYTFDHWEPESAVSKNNPLSLVLQGKLELTAQAGTAKYRVAFDPNGGTGVMMMQNYLCNETYQLPSCRFFRNEYAFLRWNTSRDGSGKSYEDGGAVTNLATEDGQTVTLYAQWTNQPYTIRFMPNGGTGNMQDQHAFRTIPTLLVPNAFTRDGFAFLGWNTQPDGSGQSYPDEAQVQDLAEGYGTVVLYAQWDNYRITSGDGSIWILGGNVPLRFTANGALKDFRKLVVDGKTVAAKDYTVSSGSTVADLNPEWLNKLSKGQHSLKMVYVNGETNTAHFTVAPKPPPTGDTFPAFPLSAGLLLSGLGLLLLTRRRKKY